LKTWFFFTAPEDKSATVLYTWVHGNRFVRVSAGYKSSTEIVTIISLSGWMGLFCQKTCDMCTVTPVLSRLLLKVVFAIVKYSTVISVGITLASKLFFFTFLSNVKEKNFFFPFIKTV